MKELLSYIDECDGACPGNTMGAGNPVAPTETTPGSGDTFDFQKRKKKRFKRISHPTGKTYIGAMEIDA